MARVFFTATARRFKPSFSGTPAFSEGWETKVRHFEAMAGPSAPYIGR
jgi:hypothetical protein